MRHDEIVILGNGIVGMALALELKRRDRDVTLFANKGAQGGASRAAAGMLAAHDPHNPAELQNLADLALTLYPAFLTNLRDLSGEPIPIQTEQVLEPADDGEITCGTLPTLAEQAGPFRPRPEQSLDPRDLVSALDLSLRKLGVETHTFETAGRDLQYHVSVDCIGAWSPHARPAKGQMLRLRLPDNALRLGTQNVVLRTPEVYLVPRLDGTAVIGATVEDAGFDLTLREEDLDKLRARAAALIPAARTAPEVERWSGLRPRTADDLPILGQTAPNRYVSNGLFRNGILLAPAVAHVIAQVIHGEAPTVPLDDFAPHRPALAASR